MRPWGSVLEKALTLTPDRWGGAMREAGRGKELPV